MTGKNIRHGLLIILIFIFPCSSSAQVSWTASPFEHQVFVKNEGQLSKEVFYSAATGGVDIFFTAKGFYYRYRKDSLHIVWEGASSAKIEADEPQAFYYTYGSDKLPAPTIKAICYKKLVYRDLYPNIDAEFILPEKGGLKYNLLLRPGADPSLIQMKYTGARSLIKDKEGNIRICSCFGQFTDHAPVSYDENGKLIPSAFELTHNTVTFSLPSSIIHHPSTITIDPWISSPQFPNNKAFDVNFDNAGNVYVHGSFQPLKLAKFSSSGVLQWVFSCTAWFGGECYADFAVDEVTGTSYIIEGFDLSRVVKVNSAGIQTGLYPGTIGGTGGPMCELWRAEYKRCSRQIVIGGGGTSGVHQAVMLDTNMVNLQPVNVISTSNAFRDVNLLATDPTGNFCYMALPQSTLLPFLDNNVVFRCPLPALFPPSFTVSNGYSFKEANSGNYFPSGCDANGFNGMACGPGWLYTFDGSTLKKWNKGTGLAAGQVNTGGGMFDSGGLSADACDNVYAGVGNKALLYDAGLNQLNSYTLPGACYDLKLGPGHKLYACGNAFVCEVDVAANAVSITVDTSVACEARGIPSCGSPGNFNWAWSPSGQNTSTATGLTAGTYTVTLSTGCTAIQTATVRIGNTCPEEEYAFYAPNTFTPDGDGLNDQFFPKGYGIDPDHFKIWIFDRWGNLIWESRIWGEGWDGRANGGTDMAQVDVYVWRCTTREKANQRDHNYIGHVTLVR